MSFPIRSHYCGDLRLEHINQTVNIMGWIFAKREYKKLVFIDLRDNKGLVQAVFSLKDVELDSITQTTLESAIWVTGIVVKRKEANPDLETGDIEVKVSAYGIFSTSLAKLPFALHEYIDTAEDLRTL